METNRSNNTNTRKRVRRRRRSHTRKIALEGVINMAEARREIASALQLHRSTTTQQSSKESRLRKNNNCNYGDNSCFNYDNVVNYNNKTTNTSNCGQYYYPLYESIPVPEPIWSTTAPAVLAVQSSGDITQLEWAADNHSSSSSSSYNWWSSFLDSLDGNINNNTEMSSIPNSFDSFKENVLVEDSMVYDGQCNSEAAVMDMDEQTPFPDEWLILPTAGEPSIWLS